jgi:hypothetical protein
MIERSPARLWKSTPLDGASIGPEYGQSTASLRFGLITVAPVEWRKLYGKLPGLRVAAFAEVTAGARDGETGEAVDLRQLVRRFAPE